MSLAQRLGYDADARLLIVTCDNLGTYHAANVACYESVNEGVATNASIMVPAPWSREAVRSYRGGDVGVHLTLNAEYSCYRWSSITHAPTLHSGEGGFPRTAADLWEHADSDEVRRECRAQIERAIVWGFDPTHLDSHLWALVLRPELFDLYLELADEFSLPVRLADRVTEENAGFPLRELAAQDGILSPDQSVPLRGEDRMQAFAELIEALEPGVTEVCLQPAIDTPELRALLGDTQDRIGDHQVLTSPATRSVLEAAGIELISWASIRDLQRSQ